MKKIIIAIALFLCAYSAFSQDTLRRRFTATVSFQNFATTPTGRYKGTLSINDQTNTFNGANVSVGDILFANTGAQYVVDTVTSTFIFLANVTIRKISGPSGNPYGVGDISKPTFNYRLSGFTPDNENGISTQLQSIKMTNFVFKADSLIKRAEAVSGIGIKVKNKYFTSTGAGIPTDSTGLWANTFNAVVLYTRIQSSATSNVDIAMAAPTNANYGDVFYIYAQDDSPTYNVRITGSNRLGTVDTSTYIMNNGETVLMIAQQVPSGPKWVFYRLGTSGGGVSDGVKGEITVSGSGTVWTVNTGAITGAKVASQTLDSLVFKNRSITTVKLADLAVTNAKIANNAVDSTKAANLSPNNLAQTGATIGQILTWTGTKYAPRAAPATGFPAAGGDLTGTAGAGFVGFMPQSSTPSTPASGFRLFANAAGKFAWIGTNGFTREFDGTANTASRIYTLPDATGTIALTSNLITSLTGDVTASGTGAVTTTIANSAVTKIKIASAAVDSTKAAGLSPNNIAQTLANTGDVLTWTGSKYAPRPAAATGFPAAGGDLTGTAGAGFVGFILQSSTPATPASGFRLFANAAGKFSWIGTNGFTREFDGTANTASRIYTLPDASGTIALTSNLSSYFPIAGGSLTGTAGTGFYGMLNQSAAPSTVSGGLALYANSSNFLTWKDAGGFNTIFAESNSADRTFTLPNASGTFGLLGINQTWTGVNSFTGTNTGFGTSSPSALALADFTSTTRGLLPPRQTTANIAANYSAISTLGSITGGSAYTNGTYSGVSLTGGTGSGATANITVSGGAVTAVTIVAAGSGYNVGDVLSASAAAIGGTGSGFSVPVASITTPQGLFVYNSTVGRLSYNNADSWKYLIGSSQTSIPSTQIAFGDANGNLQSSSNLVYNGNEIKTTGGLLLGSVGAKNASAIFQIQSTTQGILYSILDDTQQNAIASPASGLLIMNNTGSFKQKFYTGSTWAEMHSNNNAIVNTNNNQRIGNLQLLTSGNASTTGQGIIVTGSDQTMQFQGTISASLQNTFTFATYSGNASPRGFQNSNNPSSFINIFGGYTNPNTNNTTGITLNITPTYNISTFTGTRLIGVRYNPTLTSLTNTTHVAWENTTGDMLIGTTSGGLSVGATTTLAASAIAQFVSTTQGILPPVMTTTNRNAISSPANLLVIANSTTTRLNLYDNSGTAWREIPTMVSGGITNGAVVVGDANGNLVAAKALTKAVQTQNSNYDATSDLGATQQVMVYADQTSGASANTTITLPTPSATYAGQSVVIYAADAALGFKVTVACTSGIWYSTGLAAAPTTASNYDITDATTSLAWGNATLTCMLLPGSIYRWVVTNQQ